MNKRLLIAVDGSPAANAAVLEAIEMARADGSDLRLVHVIDETSVPWTDGVSNGVNAPWMHSPAPATRCWRTASP